MRAVLGMLCLVALAGCAGDRQQAIANAGAWCDKYYATAKEIADTSEYTAIKQRWRRIRAECIATAVGPAPTTKQKIGAFLGGMGSRPEGHVGASPSVVMEAPPMNRQVFDTAPRERRSFTCSRPPAYARYQYGGPTLRCREGY